MTPTEAVILLRKVRAYRPAMILDEYTGEAWAEALDDIRPQDADQALRNIARRTSDWIDPAMIRAEVKRIRTQRIAAHGEPIPPEGLTTAEYVEWLADVRRRIGDGETIHGPTYREPDHDALAAQRERQALGGAA